MNIELGIEFEASWVIVKVIVVYIENSIRLILCVKMGVFCVVLIVGSLFANLV